MQIARLQASMSIRREEKPNYNINRGTTDLASGRLLLAGPKIRPKHSFSHPKKEQEIQHPIVHNHFVSERDTENQKIKRSENPCSTPFHPITAPFTTVFQFLYVFLWQLRLTPSLCEIQNKGK